jgi:putative intracellular protease/amidase
MTDTLPFRILMLLPDEDDTGLPENAAIVLASSYYVFRDAGLEVVFASRLGGFSAISAEMRRHAKTLAVTRLVGDSFARDELSDTIPLHKVFFEDFDVLVVFVADDGATSQETANAIARFKSDGKHIVSSPQWIAGDLAWARRIAEIHGERRAD